MNLQIPSDYRAQLAPETMEQAIKMLKDFFPVELSQRLDLRRVTAPLFVLAGTGINDDLNGSERAVAFNATDLDGARVEVVHSLAKWKRLKLAAYKIAPGYGIYTDMNAIRADEVLDNLHSLYVDQWDWERVITDADRNLDFLKATVQKIYAALKATERYVYESFSHITPVLPDSITFVHAEDLLRDYPTLSPREREAAAAKKYGAIFVVGIGAKLANGEKHDGRAPDYDDWSTPTGEGRCGLNGDIVLWNDVLGSAFEISSMGVRVDKAALLRQLATEGCSERQNLHFHRMLIENRLPLSIGGGIGQSRLCMFMFRCAHIGEVQASLWSDDMIEMCRQHNIYLK